MPIALLATRVLRRVLDGLLLVLIAGVLGTLLLTRAVPILTGGTTLVVAGSSMEPTIPMGSLAYDVPVPPDMHRVGDVVSIRVGPERAIFTHRITRLVDLPDGPYLETRGDANADVDPSLVPVSAVIGRTELTIPYLGFAMAILGTLPGIGLLFAAASALLAAAWLIESLEDDQLAGVRRRAAEALAARAPEPAPELEAAA